MKQVFKLFALLAPASFSLGCVSCGSVQEEQVSVEIVSSAGNVYTCKWEEDILMKPKFVKYAVRDGEVVLAYGYEWMVCSKAKLYRYRIDDIYPLMPMDIVRYSAEATFETAGDPISFVQDNFVKNSSSFYCDLEPEKVTPTPDVHIVPLEKKEASISIIGEEKITRDSDGKIKAVDGKRVSKNDMICSKNGETLSLSESSPDSIYRAISANGDVTYFDFDPSKSFSTYICAKSIEKNVVGLSADEFCDFCGGIVHQW